MKWIKIQEVPNRNRKTLIFVVSSKEKNYEIGIVKWYSAWCRYCFFPIDQTIYEEECLRDIANFIEDQTKKYKELRKNEKRY